MWLDRFVKYLLPREEHFFDFLERGADCVLRCSNLLVECFDLESYDDRVKIVEQMRQVEVEADHVIVEVYEALNKTFVTPFDRSDIYTLAADLEAITDDLCDIALQIITHCLEDLPSGTHELIRLINEACKEVHQGVKLLRNIKALLEVRRHSKRINQLEHEGDQIFLLKSAELFRSEKDAIRLIKHKEFLEGLERALDACDDMANALETIVIKNA